MPIRLWKQALNQFAILFPGRLIDRLAYGLVKNKKPFFTGPTGSATRLFFSFLKMPFTHLF